jgi:hypothetical protein
MRRIPAMIVCVIAAAMVAVFGASTASAAVVYNFNVRTCDVKNAGTDANVLVRFAGPGGLTEWAVLNNPGDDRERGQIDFYTKALSDVGPVFALDLNFDHAGPDAGWCLEQINVSGPHSGTAHHYHGWLDDPVELTILAG